MKNFMMILMILMKKTLMNKIQMKKIECINLFLEKINVLISKRPEMQENFFKEI